VTNAAMIWTLLCVAADVDIREITHIPGEQNDNCDQLSRRGLHPTTTVMQHAQMLGITKARVIDIPGDSEIMDLIALCNPTVSISTDQQFTEFWTAARTIIDRLLDRDPAP
jgi:high-affinity K+ transport system ATPase subunit B